MTIPYVDRTWSPLAGCKPESTGCAHCWAARMAATRLSRLPKYRGLAVMAGGEPEWTGATCFTPDELEKPLHWRKPRRVFCCDMGDIALASADELEAILRTIWACQQHTFLLLTKKPSLLLEQMTVSYFPSNVHLGVTAEDQTRFNERVQWLLKAQASVKWLSLEPLLGPIDMTAEYLTKKLGCYPFPTLESKYRTQLVHMVDWCVVGCEAGPRRRPCKLEWVESIVRQCTDAGVAVWVKQLDLGDRVSRDPEEWPNHLRRRELP
jgi:protein gp37